LSGQGARRYHIHEPVGSGTFGTVYRATLEAEGGFRKEVAIKILNPKAEGWEDVARRLRDEARMLGLLQHRAILQVDGLVQLDGRWAVVMEFVNGAGLVDLIKLGPMPVGVALQVIGELAGALHFAYTQPGPNGEPLRVIHRDLKPGNVRISRTGQVKLLDFGIARAQFDERESETQSVVLGTPGYMAPERFDMRDGPEGDVYALGVLFAEVVGAVRFGRSSPVESRHLEHVRGRLVEVRGRAPQALAVVEELLLRMLAYNPEDRPSAKEVERACRKLRAEAGVLDLDEWLDGAIARIPQVTLDQDEHFSGQTLREGSGTLTASEAAGMPTDLGSDSDTAARSLMTQRLALGGALGAAGLGLVAAGLAVGALIVAILVWRPTETSVVGPGPSVVAATTPSPATPPPETPSPATPPPATPPPAPTPAPPVEQAIEAPGPGPEAAPEAGGVAVSPEPKAAAPTAIASAPKAASKAGQAAKPVTAGAFAAWLAQNPDWMPAAAKEAGRADAGYLRGWSAEGVPPDPSAPATSVSWWAAQAYCAGRGGLLDIEAAPSTWAESEMLQEWRVAANKPGWRRFDGETSTAVRRADANGFTGFRCAR
jgi:serine/threonine-protein kinase